MKTPTDILKVIKYLDLNETEIKLKPAFFPGETDSWVVDSVYTGGSFKTKDMTVIRNVASFDENEVKMVETQEFILNTLETEDFLFELVKPVDSQKLLNLARSYDLYVGARELDYREGVEMNKRTLRELKELGVVALTVKTHTPMFSQSSSDYKLL